MSNWVDVTCDNCGWSNRFENCSDKQCFPGYGPLHHPSEHIDIEKIVKLTGLETKDIWPLVETETLVFNLKTRKSRYVLENTVIGDEIEVRNMHGIACPECDSGKLNKHIWKWS